MESTALRTPRILEVAVLALIALSGCTPSPKWRREQEALVASAVVEDLIANESKPRPTSFCVFGLSDLPGDHDPDGRLLALLRSRGIDAYPISQCDGVTVIRTRAEAYIVGLESLEWRGDNFVKAEGEVRRGGMSGGTWLYTLTRTQERWIVDTVHRNKIV